MREIVNFRTVKALALTGGLALVAAMPKVAMADNLADAMIGAYQTSGLLQQNRALLRTADEDVAVAVSRLRPIIDWTVSANRDYSENSATREYFQTGVALSWLLYDSGASKYLQLATQETVLSTRQSLIDVEQRVLFDAVAAYIDVLLQNDTVALRRNNLRLLQEELKAAQDRFEVGEVTRTDVALAESRVAAAQANLTESRGDLLTAEAVYAEVVGNPPGTLAGQPSLPRRVASLQAAEAVALRNHPRLLSQQHAVKAAGHSVQNAAKSLGPSVDFSARAFAEEAIGNSTAADSTGVSLTFSQRLYQGGALAAGLRSAMAREDAARGVLISNQREISRQVAASYVALETARASLVSSNERVRAAQVAFDGIREEATLGARTTLDVLQSEQELLDAQTARVQARATQALAAYALLQSQGLLTAEHLGLAVEIYDPTVYYNLVKDAPALVSQRSKDLDRVLKALGKK